MEPPPPTFREACRFWVQLGFVNFGGPTGQIALMHAEVVEKRRWVSEGRFLHALNYCMLLPGPEAQQLAIYLGWLLHGVRGGLAAGTFFVLPAAGLLWGLSWLYVAHGTAPAVAALFYGLKPAVVAVVAAAFVRLGRRALKGPALRAVALAGFAAIYFLHAPFPAVVFGAALLGFAGGRLAPRLFPAPETPAEEEAPPRPAPGAAATLRTLAIGLTAWLGPLALLALALGRHTVVEEGLFFAKAALVTFGGAYAVLPYVAQQAVDHYQWLAPGQMIDGLGLAETTPGPLIIVLQFVGFVGAWNHPGALPPLLAATLGAFAATWATFAPCFLWIFLGAPHIERLRGGRRAALAPALAAVTAAVVGVMLSLAVWFGVHVFFPEGKGCDGFAVALALLAFAALERLKWSPIAVIGGCAAAGLLWRLLA